MASRMLLGVWACLRVRSKSISFRQFLNVVSLICHVIANASGLVCFWLRQIVLTPSRMCFYLYVFLAAAQLFPCLTAAFPSTLELWLSARR